MGWDTYVTERSEITMIPKKKVGSSVRDEESEGSEVSGGPVRRIVSESYYDDGSKHTTESIVTSGSNRRMSWDTDSEGETSNFHSTKNG